LCIDVLKNYAFSQVEISEEIVQLLSFSLSLAEQIFNWEFTHYRKI